MATTSETRVVPQMLDLYNQQLQRQTQNYNTVLGAYSGGQQNLNAQLPGVYGDYGNLGRDIQGTFDRSYEAGARDIRGANAYAIGKAQQAAINSGLGGSTVMNSYARGVAADTSRAYGRLAADIGERSAARREQVGLAGLAARMQGLGMQTGLQQNMAGVLAGYQGFGNHVGSLTGGYSHSDAGGYGGGGGTFPGMMGGSGGGGVSGLENLLGGIGGGAGHANYGGGGGMGAAGPGVAYGNYWTGGMNGAGGMTGNQFGGGSQTVYPGGDDYLNQLGYGSDRGSGQDDLDWGSEGFGWGE